MSVREQTYGLDSFYRMLKTNSSHSSALAILVCFQVDLDYVARNLEYFLQLGNCHLIVKLQSKKNSSGKLFFNPICN